MRVCLGIDQPGVDPHLAARPLDTAFQHIADAELAADLLCGERLVAIREGGMARDHERVRDPRQIGRQIVGDPVRKVLLVGVAAEIDEGQYDDRQARRDDRLRD
jgi:hypothetical protein